MQIPVIKINQNQKDLFVTAISARDLMKLTKVDLWLPEKEGTKDQGYQRAAEKYHIAKIATYLQAENALLPNAILLNSRKALGFVENEKDSMAGTINLKPSDVLWNVDGQHRVAGLKQAIEDGHTALEDFFIPVVIANGLLRDEEMLQFFTVNKTQKGVRTDLTERLMVQKAKTDEGRDDLRGSGKYWIVRAVKIADYLNHQPGPWQGRIQVPNTATKTPAKQASVTKSLQPLLKGGFLEDQSDSLACQLMLVYWKAIQDVFPEAFVEPTEYAIQKTAGLFPLHAVANRIFRICQSEKNSFKQSKMADLLRKTAEENDMDSDFWRLNNTEGATLYGSMKGFRILADRILDKLPTADVKVEE
ncbi:MAG: DGQHR domain-containing protein [Thermodesulfobacteriota bacterium]